MLDLEYLMRIRGEELNRRINHYRLISQPGARSGQNQPTLRNTLVWLGSLLSKWGEALQTRFETTEVPAERRSARLPG